MAGSSPISDIYFFTISAMDLSEIAVFRNDIDLVKPRNTGPDVMPLAVNHFLKLVRHPMENLVDLESLQWHLDLLGQL